MTGLLWQWLPGLSREPGNLGHDHRMPASYVCACDSFRGGPGRTQGRPKSDVEPWPPCIAADDTDTTGDHRDAGLERQARCAETAPEQSLGVVIDGALRIDADAAAGLEMRECADMRRLGMGIERLQN